MTEASLPDPKPSCALCPNFMAADDFEGQINAYGMTINVPSCALKNRILGGIKTEKSDEANAKIQEAIAGTCDMYGKRAPRSTKNAPALKVSLPTQEVATNQEKPSTCRSCQFYIPGKEITQEIPFASGLCSRRGLLIAETKTTSMAKNCTVGGVLYPNVGETLDSHYANLLGDIVIFPELRPVLFIGPRIGCNLPAAPVIIVDPQEYETDAEVSQEDKDCGIRAWRRVDNDDHTRSVMLPIFDRKFFEGTPDVRKIPITGDDNHPELYRDHGNLTYKIAAIWEMGETPALHGVAGTGKTEAFRYFAWLMGLPFERVSITASTEIDDLAGRTHFKEGVGTYFVEGRIPTAWAKPCVQVIDEPNVGGSEVWQFIRPMTDNAKQLVLDMNEGQVIDRNPFSFLGMAMNPSWDSKNIGAEQIADADGSRLMHIFVDFPDNALESEIIKKRCALDNYDIDKNVIRSLLSISDALRELSADGVLPVSWGVRQNIKVARALKWFPMGEAFRLAAADYLEPEARQLILDEVNKKTAGNMNTTGDRRQFSHGGRISNTF